MPIMLTKVLSDTSFGDFNLAAFASACAAIRTAVGDRCNPMIHVGEAMHFPVGIPVHQ